MSSFEDQDDFLWNCALENSVEERKWCVPDYEDEAHHFLGGIKDEHCTIEITDQVQHRGDSWIDTNVDNEVVIGVVEIRGNGVLDMIGGEVWEASLILCAYIIQNPCLFLHHSVLELGSGLGLPAFLIAELRTKVIKGYHSRTQYIGKRTCLTDNDPRCIETLINSIQTRRSDNSDPSLSKGCLVSQLISVAMLDWSMYTDPPTVSLDHPLHQSHYGVLFGSALVYSPYHTCLADTIKHYIDEGSCREVVIIQIADRAGFDMFLDRLQLLGLECTVIPISHELYNAAQCIGCMTTTMSSTLSVGSSSSSTASSSTAPASNIATEEDEVKLEKRFVFPREMKRTVSIRRSSAVIRAATLQVVRLIARLMRPIRALNIPTSMQRCQWRWQQGA